jgi:hypothetical protein
VLCMSLQAHDERFVPPVFEASHLLFRFLPGSDQRDESPTQREKDRNISSANVTSQPKPVRKERVDSPESEVSLANQIFATGLIQLMSPLS